MRCPRCYLHLEVCLCAAVVPVATRTRVLILRHCLERHKRSNSARWAALALPRCDVVEYGGPGARFDASALLGPGTWLLYPGGAAAPGRPDTLLVLDGTWAQTRRMLQRVPGLATLPRLALPAPPPRRRLRRPPPGGHATLEAIARALERLEGPDAAAPLDALYAEAVRRSVVDPGILRS